MNHRRKHLLGGEGYALTAFVVFVSLTLGVWGCGSNEMNALQGTQETTTENIFFDNQLTKNNAPDCIFADPQKLVSLFNPNQQPLGPGKERLF